MICPLLGSLSASCFHPKYAETAVVVVEGDALYDAGNLLGRGSALWDCGVHLVGSYFPTDRVNRFDARMIRHALTNSLRRAS